MEKKLIYIMNHYSNNSAKHFYHIINLLDTMANKGVKIVLIIEKADDIPKINNSNIDVVTQKETKYLKRALELRRVLVEYYKKGFKNVFVRISSNAILIAIYTASKYGVKTYYWNSGDNITYDRKKPILDRIKWYFTGYQKLLYIKKNVDYFVTGPETMIEYYINNLGIKREKMLLLYNDIDTTRFSLAMNDDKLNLRKQLELPLDKKIVLFVHRLTPVKRFSLQIPLVAENDLFTDNNGL